jgi:hypothetical protein
MNVAPMVIKHYAEGLGLLSFYPLKLAWKNLALFIQCASFGVACFCNFMFGKSLAQY